MKEFCQKWKVKLIFRGAYRLSQEPGLLSVWKSLTSGVIWSSVMAWPDWPRQHIFYHRSTTLRVTHINSCAVVRSRVLLQLAATYCRSLQHVASSCNVVLQRDERLHTDDYGRSVDAALRSNYVTIQSEVPMRRRLRNDCYSLFLPMAMSSWLPSTL